MLLFSAGIVLGHYAVLEPSWPLALTVGVFLSAGLIAVARPVSPLLDVLLILSVVSLGTFLHSQQREMRTGKKLIPDEDRETIVVRGVVAEEAFRRGNQLQFIVATDRIFRQSRVKSGERRIIVRGSKKALNVFSPVLHVGTELELRGVLDEYPQPRNPGEFDYGRYLELNDIDGIVQVSDSTMIRILSATSSNSFRALISRFRNSLSDALDAVQGESAASFLRGILLADRSNIASEVKQAFVDTGTIHVLAVSGLHVGVVATVFYGFFGLLRLKRKPLIVATTLGLVSYMVLIGSPPSVVRSTIMAIVLLVGPFLERRTDVYQSLGVAAMMLLVADTNNLFNVGFQLSFAAVLSIVYFYPFFVNILNRIPERFEEIKMLNPVLKLFAVSLAAQLGTLPFTAYYFDRISIVSLFANLVVVPIVGVNVMLGFATLASSAVSSWVAQCYAALNEWLVTFLLGFVKVAADVPYAYVQTERLGTSFPILYYLCLIGIVNISQKKVVKSTLIACLVVLNCLIYAELVNGTGRDLTVTAIDVGQGDALLIEFPGGTNMLVDAGPRSLNYDSGERIVAPFLRHKGVERLDAIMLSHPHSDHIGGVPYLLEHFGVARLLEPSFRGESSLYRKIHNVARSRSVPVFHYSTGDTIDIDDNARLYVLHPYAQTDSATNLNNASIVVKLVYGATEILLTGDAELEVEKKLLRRYAAFLRSDLLKAAHHGSSTSSSQGLVKAVRPAMTIVSVGRNNKFRHPSPSVMELFRKEAIRILRTDKEGAIVLESDGKEWKVVPWRQ